MPYYGSQWHRGHNSPAIGLAKGARGGPCVARPGEDGYRQVTYESKYI